MIRSLTPVQLNILRRCTDGLRVWEIGAEREALLQELATLRQRQLVQFDEARGFELTRQGEACLVEADAVGRP